ncbi:MAG: hypothetical protein ABIC57_01850 [bacterium]
MPNIQRPKELGKLIVIGGPGGSGSSTISKMFSRKWYLHRLYGGDLIRKKAGYQVVEEFIKSDLKDNEKIDMEVDEYLLKMSFQKNILIEIKVFAALSLIRYIHTTLKIWLHADVETSVRRIFERENWNIEEGRFQEEVSKLKQRRQNDVDRYMKIYKVDISTPEKYNDIMLDTSKLDVYNTGKAIIDKIKSDPVLLSCFSAEDLKY